MINLESVGTGIDLDGMTYPMLESGGYDYDNGIHLDDIEPDGDWMLALDEADQGAVDEFRLQAELRSKNRLGSLL